MSLCVQEFVSVFVYHRFKGKLKLSQSRERERERETDRQTDRNRQRETETDGDRVLLMCSEIHFYFGVTAQETRVEILPLSSVLYKL